MPAALPRADPPVDLSNLDSTNRKAELALARLVGVAGLVPSVDWLLYSAIRTEALLTSQIEATQATLTDLFDEEAGLAVTNTEDQEELGIVNETTGQRTNRQYSYGAYIDLLSG